MFAARYDLNLTIKQIKLIRSMVDLACLIWVSAALIHVRTLQVPQSKYFRFYISALWNTGNGKIHEELEVLYSSDHMRSLTERLKISWFESPLFRQIH
jgi:hypothetical protein